MVKVAEQLITQKSGKFDSSDFEDRYEKRLRELLDAKLAGKDLPPIEVPKPNVVDLRSALKASIEHNQGPMNAPAHAHRTKRTREPMRKRA